MMFRIPFFTRRDTSVARLHGAIMAAAREPEIYAVFGVRDDFEGRFEMLALVATLVLRRLGALPAPSGAVAQALVDGIFDGLDDGLRRAGVGDLSVGGKVRKLAQGFYGRAGAYTEALDSGDGAALRAALSRNLFAGRLAPETVPDGLVAWLAALETRLAGADLDTLLAGAWVAGGRTPIGGSP